jgi:hypothetical protein
LATNRLSYGTVFALALNLYSYMQKVIDWNVGQESDYRDLSFFVGWLNSKPGHYVQFPYQ